jgi:hypothetical protein
MNKSFTVSHQIAIHGGGSLITLNHVGAIVWLSVNDDNQVPTIPELTVYFSRGMTGVQELRALMLQLEQAEQAMLAEVERAQDEEQVDA